MLLRDSLACLSLLGLLAVPLRPARACGPDFPPTLLEDRAGVLSVLPTGIFMFEAGRLVPSPADDFKVVEGSEEEPEGARTGGGAEETARYTAGAVAFRDSRPEEAVKHFEDVLALPPAQRRHFSTFAAYMLGRLSSGEDARKRFAEVRALAREGYADPLGLAVASFGEEALGHLGDDDAAAVRLYAQQAAHGSTTGRSSLLFVARALSRNPERLRKALSEPVVQRLLTTYAWTRGHEEVWSEEAGRNLPPPLKPLLEALGARPTLAGADRLAAAAWEAGRFDLAERFAARERTPLSAWVRAKLALRRGDRTAADQLLAEAHEGFAYAEDWEVDPYKHPLRPRAHVDAERTLLALMREDFPQATEHVLSSCSWPDIAYVTERVLSADELKQVLATHDEAPELKCQPEPLYSESESVRPRVSEQLRLLLGRRLLREGRGAEALEYFRGEPLQEEHAQRYVDALERARSAWRNVDRVEALFTASQLARSRGMVLLGTEGAPDWSWVGGEYEVGDWVPSLARPEDAPPALPELASLALISPGERARLDAHVPAHLTRFQYRATAADLAEQAAALVPERSQAWAALLCHAARYIFYRDPERAEQLWRTYVQKGAYLPDGSLAMFGLECPAPDFARLKARGWAPYGENPRWRALALGAVVLLGGLGLGLWGRARRLRARRAGSPPSPR